MKYAVLMGALAFMLYGGVCEAENGKVENAPVDAEVSEEVEEGTGLRHIDVGDDSDSRVEEPVSQIGVMSPGESYDENTGLPDVVESDSSMEIQ